MERRRGYEGYQDCRNEFGTEIHRAEKEKGGLDHGRNEHQVLEDRTTQGLINSFRLIETYLTPVGDGRVSSGQGVVHEGYVSIDRGDHG